MIALDALMSWPLASRSRSLIKTVSFDAISKINMPITCSQIQEINLDNVLKARSRNNLFENKTCKYNCFFYVLILFITMPHELAANQILIGVSLEPQAEQAAVGIPTPTSELTFSSDAEQEKRVERMLSRPLFSQTRKPQVVHRVAGSVFVLPRLTGLIVTSNARFAIMSLESEKFLSVFEGDKIGLMQVLCIDKDHVTITAPDGRHELYLAADPLIRAKYIPKEVTNASLLVALRFQVTPSTLPTTDSR